jgi:inosine/xanthosine triphosphatase
MNICVGSLNPVKIDAVRLAFGLYFEDFRVSYIEAESSVPNQPIGLDNILLGAQNRAQQALTPLIEDSNASPPHYGIGIEAGLVKIPIAPSNYMDFQFCVIMDEHQKITIGSGIGFEYPKKVINKVLFNKKEIGHIMGEIANNENLKRENGAIGYLSKNTINRIDILKDAVICALLPRINKSLYE